MNVIWISLNLGRYNRPVYSNFTETVTSIALGFLGFERDDIM